MGGSQTKLLGPKNDWNIVVPPESPQAHFKCLKHPYKNKFGLFFSKGKHCWFVQVKANDDIHAKCRILNAALDGNQSWWTLCPDIDDQNRVSEFLHKLQQETSGGPADRTVQFIPLRDLYVTYIF